MRLGRPTRRLAGTTYVVLATAAAGTLLAGCGSSDKADDPASTSAGSPATPTSTTTPTTPTTSSAPASPTASTPPGRPADRLLTAAELPTLSERSRWTQGTTGPADSKPIGACDAADLTSIGARSVVARTYASGAAEAVEQLATFPDAATAVRASRVLATWHDTCQRRVDDLRHLRVDPAQVVGVIGGTASWYLTSWTPAGSAGGHFQAVGVVLAPRSIVLLAMDHEGQDHDYPPGGDPMIAAVKAAAVKASGGQE